MFLFPILKQRAFLQKFIHKIVIPKKNSYHNRMMQRDTQATGKQLSVFWKCSETCSQRSLAEFVASDFRISAKINSFLLYSNKIFYRSVT